MLQKDSSIDQLDGPNAVKWRYSSMTCDNILHTKLRWWCMMTMAATRINVVNKRTLEFEKGKRSDWFSRWHLISDPHPHTSIRGRVCPFIGLLVRQANKTPHFGVFLQFLDIACTHSHIHSFLFLFIKVSLISVVQVDITWPYYLVLRKGMMTLQAVLIITMTKPSNCNTILMSLGREEREVASRPSRVSIWASWACFSIRCTLWERALELKARKTIQLYARIR